MRLFYLRCLVLLYLCLGLWLCFALCQRIFLCCLRSFALARATSPCQSPRAGPQRFLVWVRVWWCCAFHKQNAKYSLPAWCAAHSIAVGDFVTVLFKLSASFSFPYLTKVKLSKRKICASQRLSQISFIAVLSSPSITTLANAGMHIRSMPIGAR